jgi:arabinose-5-phosphate isomerase
VKEVIIAMTRCPLGAACVLEADGTLAGLITDGDLRRALTHHDDIRHLSAADLMTRQPVSIGPDARVGDALERMEQRNSQISVLPVLDSGGRCIGLIRLHDVFRGGPQNT